MSSLPRLSLLILIRPPPRDQSPPNNHPQGAIYHRPPLAVDMVGNHLPVAIRLTVVTVAIVVGSLLPVVAVADAVVLSDFPFIHQCGLLPMRSPLSQSKYLLGSG